MSTATNWLLFLLIVALAVWVARQSRGSGAVFVVRIRGGVAKKVRGTVRPEFLSVVTDLCGDHGIEKGEIRGEPSGRFIRLRFSPRLPFGFCQELRNWWASTV